MIVRLCGRAEAHGAHAYVVLTLPGGLEIRCPGISAPTSVTPEEAEEEVERLERRSEARQEHIRLLTNAAVALKAELRKALEQNLEMARVGKRQAAELEEVRESYRLADESAHQVAQMLDRERAMYDRRLDAVEAELEEAKAAIAKYTRGAPPPTPPKETYPRCTYCGRPAHHRNSQVCPGCDGCCPKALEEAIEAQGGSNPS